MTPPESSAGYPREVETDRLLLRQFRDDDFEPYLRIVSNPDCVAPYASRGPAELETTRGGHGDDRRCLDHPGYGYWAVELKATGELIGRVGSWFPAGIRRSRPGG